MIKKGYRLLAIILSLFLFFNLTFVSSMKVEASVTGTRITQEIGKWLAFFIQNPDAWEATKENWNSFTQTENFVTFRKIISYISGLCGYVVGFPYGEDLAKSFIDLFVSSEDIPFTDENGNVSDATVELLTQLLEEYQKNNAPKYVTFMPQYFGTISPVEFGTYENYARRKEEISSVTYGINSNIRSSGRLTWTINKDNFAFFVANGNGSQFDAYASGETNNLTISSYNKDWKNSSNTGSKPALDRLFFNESGSLVREPATNSSVDISSFNINYFYSYSSSPIFVFRTITDAVDFVTCHSPIYRGTSGYTGGGIEIPEGAFNIDYNEMYEALRKAIEDAGGALSPDQIQEIIAGILEKLLESGNIGGGGSTDVSGIEGWLEKIHDTLKKILSQVTQIKWLSVADLIDDILFNILEMKSEFEPLLETMSRKFPFSIPWDAMLVFGLLADTPETPYYELPFVIESAGINEVIIVDLERFKGLSNISRFLLTLTFLMMLFALSRKIAQWFNSN